MKFTIEIEITEERIKDVIVSAIEGGSNYWAMLNNASRKAIRDKVSAKENPYLSEAITEAAFKGAVIPVYDVETGEQLGVYSKESIEAGLQLMINQERDEIDDIIEETDDAGTADVLFQYCVMGEIVFG